MEPVYIFSSGFLRRKNETLVLETEQGSKYIPVENVSEIKIFGEVDINKRALEFLTEKSIVVHFFNYYGYYVGTFYPREHLNSGYVILKQAEFYLNPAKRLNLAKKFVFGAIKNAINVLKSRNENLESEIKKIQEHLSLIDKCDSIEQLMAIEGNVKEIYYSCFDKILQGSDFVFERRTRQPPENELNAMISFGNSLLYTSVLSEIYKTHLDPRIGYLHTTNNRRFTLNLDVAEIFKPVIVDRLIFALVNRKQIKKNDFEPIVNGLVLKEKARQTFIRAFEDRLKETVYHRSLKRNVSYRSLIRMEIYKIEKHLMEDEEYKPYIFEG
ncbi:type I-B CRISPR-associated endonuclease Cas1b [Pseudothermotoga thermarum]|uniref:CRISPR-associated endonuclease Cas1 n=1 Tax=Pseudothermotoga thermarum DSM 5069 TaxID=688269 RepID=F7YXE3_9THEM|nr:CRISPR-associated protein, Cas1 family [Pseudothermotoga thermarum DSM 5069]